MYKHLIGQSSDKVLNTIERGAVKKFAESIGDLHPVYIDPDYRKHSRYETNIAPPTFPRVFDYGKIKGLHLPKAGIIHGEQRFQYVRPLFVGEDVYCYSEIRDYYEKSGSKGTMGFLVTNYCGEDPQGNTLFTSTSIVIITEAVRKGMGK